MSAARESILFGAGGGQHKIASFVDHRESYGPHVVEDFVRTLQDIQVAVDLGAGSGRDLAIVKRSHPAVRTIAVECQQTCAAALTSKVDQVNVLDIERDSLPLSNESTDLIIANQLLEHTKEVFWIFPNN